MNQYSYLSITIRSTILLVLFAVLFLNTPAVDASCAEPGNPDVEFANTAAVFSGKVMYISDSNIYLTYFTNRILGYKNFNSRDYYEKISYGRSVTFEVGQAWKGVETTTIQIRTGYTTGDSSGYPFVVGQDYLVYASHAYGKPDEYLLTSLCHRTRELSSASFDLAYLNTLPTLPLSFSLPTMMILNIAFLALTLLISGFVYIKKHRTKLAEIMDVESEG